MKYKAKKLQKIGQIFVAAIKSGTFSNHNKNKNFTHNIRPTTHSVCALFRILYIFNRGAHKYRSIYNQAQIFDMCLSIVFNADAVHNNNNNIHLN